MWHLHSARLATSTAGLILVAGLVACTGAHVPPDHRRIGDAIRERTGQRVDLTEERGERVIPEDVDLADGLAQAEAVALALWNNAAFRADLAELGLARADLVEAGLLRNPVLSLLLPWGPKQLEATLKWPTELIWQRPRRVTAARLRAEALAEGLVQHGLALVADVKTAYARVAVAAERATLAQETAAVRRQIADIAAARLRAGDISELEAAASETEALRTEAEARSLAHESTAARDRLRSLIGFGTEDRRIDVQTPALPGECGALDDLLTDALAARPDVRAAEIAVEAAASAAGWERARALSLTAVLDANAEGIEGFEAGPGVEADLPIFWRNQGGIARSEAELERATRRYVRVRESVVLEVREGFTRLAQARDASAASGTRILPSLEASLARTERALQAGEASRLDALRARALVNDARAQYLEATVQLFHAAAQLEQRVGRACAARR